MSSAPPSAAQRSDDEELADHARVPTQAPDQHEPGRAGAALEQVGLPIGVVEERGETRGGERAIRPRQQERTELGHVVLVQLPQPLDDGKRLGRHRARSHLWNHESQRGSPWKTSRPRSLVP